MTFKGNNAFRPLSISQSWLIVSLLTSISSIQAEAATQQHSISAQSVNSLAGRLVEMTADKDVESSCRLHLIEVENFSDPLLTEETLRTLEASLKDALRERYPGVACEAGFLEGADDPDAAEISARLAQEGRPGFVYTLSFFPRSEGLLLLATAYLPDGRFAAFSNQFDIDTVVTEADRPATAAAVSAPETAAVEEPVTASPSTAAEGSLAAIGTPAEIAAIRAKKFAVMPADLEPSPPPEIGLRIDIGGAVEPTVIKSLARAFLSAQSETPFSELVVEDGNHLRIAGQEDVALKGVEILDSDRSDALDRLFRGDVDLVVSSEPISQADYDRFAEAFGVDMRSGAGETVIGIDAAGLIVHESNNLSR